MVRTVLAILRQYFGVFVNLLCYSLFISNLKLICLDVIIVTKLFSYEYMYFKLVLVVWTKCVIVHVYCSKMCYSTCILCCEIASLDKSPLTKSHKSRFAALAETINSWEDEVTPPSAKSVTCIKILDTFCFKRNFLVCFNNLTLYLP